MQSLTDPVVKRYLKRISDPLGRVDTRHSFLAFIFTNDAPLYAAVGAEVRLASSSKAYLNWILSDDQFNYDSASSGAEALVR